MPRFTRCNTNGRYTQAQLGCLNERYEICLRKVGHSCDREALREYVGGMVQVDLDCCRRDAGACR